MKVITGKHRKEIEDAKKEILKRLEYIKYAVTYMEKDPEYFFATMEHDLAEIMELVKNEF